MNPSLEFLQRCSDENGFAVEPLEKAVRLGDLAFDISHHPFLGQVLALKGGTALNLCFGKPIRLSVDLDYNYFGQLDRAAMLADRPKVEAAVADLAKRKGYVVQQSRDAFAGRKLFLVFQSVLGVPSRIEIDLNYLFRLPINGIETRQMWQPGGLDDLAVRTVDLREIVLGKMLALLDRTAIRDVWDVACLHPEAVTIFSSPDFRAQFIAMSVILNHPLPSYSRDVIENRITDRSITEQLKPMLVSEALITRNDLLEKAWHRLAPFLVLQPNEHEYITSIEKGELRVELLFTDDPVMRDHIARHPALLWKMTNVREYLTGKLRRPKRSKKAEE